MENSEQTISQNKWLRSFAPVWAGQAFSLLGSSLVQFALVWWLTIKTGSTVVLATATLVALLPDVFLGPFAGALVDRWNRRRVMIVADACIALTTLGLVFLFITGAIQPWHIYVAMFLRSLGGGFHYPAMAASTTLMVPGKHLARMEGANQALRGLMSIAAPPLGALLLSLMPMQSVLAIDIITAALAITPLLFIAIPQPVREEETITMRLVLSDVRLGFKYVATWPGLLFIILIATMLNFLLVPAFTFLPLLVTQHFLGGAAEYGWLESLFGIGVITGGILLSVWGGFRRKILTIMIALIGMGIGVLAIGFAPGSGYSIALGAMALTGMMSSLANGPLGALMQAKIEPEKQGRVFTMINSLAAGMSPIAMVFAAPVAEWLGLQSWYLIAGAFCIVMATFGMLNKAVMTIDSQSQGGKIMEMQPAQVASD